MATSKPPGSGFLNTWQLIKSDILIHTLYSIWIGIGLIQIVSTLFHNPWTGIIVFTGAILNIVMLLLVINITPSRLARLKSRHEAISRSDRAL